MGNLNSKSVVSSVLHCPPHKAPSSVVCQIFAFVFGPSFPPACYVQPSVGACPVKVDTDNKVKAFLPALGWTQLTSAGTDAAWVTLTEDQFLACEAAAA